MSQGNSLKAVVVALFSNAFIALIKFIVAFITTSAAMMAEAIHSTADCMNQIFLLIGSKRTKKVANEQHSFGYGKEEYFWGFIVATLLFFVGGGFSIYEGIISYGDIDDDWLVEATSMNNVPDFIKNKGFVFDKDKIRLFSVISGG